MKKFKVYITYSSKKKRTKKLGHVSIQAKDERQALKIAVRNTEHWVVELNENTG